MDHIEVLSYIDSLKKRGSKPGLSRIRQVLAGLGDPQKKLKAIHVAGTNGKGSFCFMLEKVLQSSGFKTGRFSSPYMTDIRDMFSIDARIISEAEFDLISESIIPICERYKLTEYEFYTVLAFCFFAAHSPDLVIVECCMGGRLDATNVIDHPLLSVITGIALEHTAYLGDTLQSIASHKAGIIKKDCPVLAGNCPAEAMKVIRRRAYYCRSKLYKTDFSKIRSDSARPDGSVFSYKSHTGIFLSLAGNYQQRNAANLLEACDILSVSGYKISEENIKSALCGISFPGRFEIFSTDPYIIYDGCHNPDGAKALVSSVKEIFGKTAFTLIIGVMADKNYTEMAKTLSSVAKRAIAIRPENNRALDPTVLAGVFSKIGVSAAPAESLEIAVEEALAKDAPVLVIGSLYTYKDFVRVINKIQLKKRN